MTADAPTSRLACRPRTARVQSSGESGAWRLGLLAPWRETANGPRTAREQTSAAAIAWPLGVAPPVEPAHG
jgi:hypothetical protein